MLCFSAAFSQTGIIKGKVTTSGNNTPIDFASVVAEATGLNITTDENGNVSRVILKKELGEYLKTGEVVEGASLIKKPYLRIK